MMPGGTLSNSLHHRSTKRTAHRRRPSYRRARREPRCVGGHLRQLRSRSDLRRARRVARAGGPRDLGRSARGPERPRGEGAPDRTRRCRRLARRRSRRRVRPRYQSCCGELPERPWSAADRRGRCRDARGPHAGCGACRDRRHRRVGARGAGRCGQGTPAVIDRGGRVRAGRTRRGVRRGHREGGEEFPALERSRAHGDRQRGNHGETGHDGGSRARRRTSRRRRCAEPICGAEDRRAGSARQVVATGTDQQRDHAFSAEPTARSVPPPKPPSPPIRAPTGSPPRAPSTRRPRRSSAWVPPPRRRPHPRRQAIRTSG